MAKKYFIKEETPQATEEFLLYTLNLFIVGIVCCDTILRILNDGFCL